MTCTSFLRHTFLCSQPNCPPAQPTISSGAQGVSKVFTSRGLRWALVLPTLALVGLIVCRCKGESAKATSFRRKALSLKPFR